MSSESQPVSTDHTSAPPSRRRRLIKRILVGLSSLLGVSLAVVFAILAGAANPMLNRYIDEVSGVISEDLGRELSISSADVRVFPWLVFELNDVRVKELASIGKVSVQADTWRALWSLGGDIRVKEMSVERASVTLARDREGVWNFEPRDQSTQPEEVKRQSDTEAEGAPADRAALLNALKLEQVHVSDLSVTLRDELTRPGEDPVELARLNLEFPLLDVARHVTAEVRGELLQADAPLHLQLDVGPYDHLIQAAPTSDANTTTSPSEVASKEQSISGDTTNPLGVDAIPLPLSLSVKTGRLNLALLTPFLDPTQVHLLKSLKTGGELKLDLTPREGARLSGAWSASGVPIDQQGKHIAAAITPKIFIKLGDEPSVQVAGTSITVDGMSLRLLGGLKLSESGPRLQALGVKTDRIDLSKMLSLAPQAKSALPPNSKISGPLELSVRTSGSAQAQSLKLALSLDRSTLSLPGVFEKQSDEPLNLRADVAISAQTIGLREVLFTLGKAALSLQGELGLNPKSPRADLKLSLPSVELNDLARFSPLARETIKQTPARGQLYADLKFKLSGSPAAPQVKLSAVTRVQNASLSAPELKVIGSSEIKVDVDSGKPGDFSATLDGDMSPLALRFGDVFNKPAQLPLKVRLSASRRAGRLEVPSLDLQVAQLKLQGRGAHDAEGFVLKTALPPSPLKSALKMFGAARTLGADLHNARLSFQLEARAHTQQTLDLTLSLSKLRLKSSKNDLNAELKVLTSPQLKITSKVNASKFNLDAMFPPSAEPQGSQSSSPSSSKSATAEQGSTQSAQPPSALPLSLDSLISIKKGVARGISFRDLKLRASVRAQTVRLDEGRVKVFGGEVQVTPLELSLSGASSSPAQWRAGLELENIDLKSASRALTGSPSELSGLLSGGLKLSGEGLTWAEIAPALEGQGKISLRRGALSTLKLQNQLMGGINKKLKLGRKQRRRAGRSLKLKTLSGAVRIREGRLSFDEPLKSETPDGPLLMTGYLGLDGSLQLKSKLQLSAQRVSSWVKRRITTPSSFPITFTIGGSLTQPKLQDLAAVALISAVAVAYGLSQVDGAQVKKSAERLIKKAKGEAKARVDEAKRKAEQASREAKRKAEELRAQAEREANQKAQEAKRKAQEAKRKAQEAKRKAQKAKRKAKREAKKRRKQAQDALKGIF